MCCLLQEGNHSCLDKTGWIIPFNLEFICSLLNSQACVPVWHLEHWIIHIIWDQYIACLIAKLGSLRGIHWIVPII